MASLLACGVAYAADSADVIVSPDPRFEVFELADAHASGMTERPVGTVMLSFVSRDNRYCRVARFDADYTVVLACREPAGWRIEASSQARPGASTATTAYGGTPSRDVPDAIEALRTDAELLDGRQIMEAAARNWLNPVPVDLKALTGRDILRRTARVYQRAESYVDTGTVRTRYRTPDGDRVGETRFETAYVAPHHFRFESHMGDFGNITVGFIAWRDEHHATAWSSVDPALAQKVTSIQGALDAGAGISRDTSGMIPGLIIQGTKLGGDIVRLRNPKRLEDGEVDGHDCFRVQGERWPHDGPTVVWIDSESFLIRRVDERDVAAGDLETETTWSYDPAINVPVDPASLRFDMPAPSS